MKSWIKIYKTNYNILGLLCSLYSQEMSGARHYDFIERLLLEETYCSDRRRFVGQLQRISIMIALILHT